MNAILVFLGASALTVFGAIKLARYGDAIAETTGLGKSLVGLILLAAATSLPELFSSSSASFIGNVDLAFGNVFGSNMTNIFILVIMDFFVRNRPILYGASEKNVMTGGIVILITSLTLLMIYVANHDALSNYDFWYFSPILFLFYVGGMIIIYFYEKAHQDKQRDDLPEQNNSPNTNEVMTKKKAIIGFSLSSAVVFVAAIFLSDSCNSISQLKIGGVALGGTFVGSVLMAFTTSLPEVIVSIAALKIGSEDMALGNLFGSNLFNLAILSFSDGFYRLGGFIHKEAIVTDAFTKANPNHLVSGIMGVTFVGIVLASIMLRIKKKHGPLGMDTLSIGILYILGMFLLYILEPGRV